MLRSDLVTHGAPHGRQRLVGLQPEQSGQQPHRLFLNVARECLNTSASAGAASSSSAFTSSKACRRDCMLDGGTSGAQCKVSAKSIRCAYCSSTRSPSVIAFFRRTRRGGRSPSITARNSYRARSKTGVSAQRTVGFHSPRKARGECLLRVLPWTPAGRVFERAPNHVHRCEGQGRSGASTAIERRPRSSLGHLTPNEDAQRQK